MDTYNLTIWDREIWARLITEIDRYNPSIIGCNILFKDPLPSALHESETSFIEAVRKSGKLVLPLIINTVSKPGNKETTVIDYNTLSSMRGVEDIILPYNNLYTSAIGAGHINKTTDVDGVDRKYPLLISSPSGYIPSFPLVLVCAYLNVPLFHIDVEPGKYVTLKNAQFFGGVVRDISIPVDEHMNIMLNFPGPLQDSFHIINGATLLEPGNNRDSLNNILNHSLVMVSDISTLQKDIATGIFDPVYPSNGVVMTVINSILTGNFLYKTHIILIIILHCIIVCFLFAGINKLKFITFTITAVVFFIFYYSFNCFLFIVFKQVSPALLPALGYLLACISLILCRGLITEKEKALKLVENKRIQGLNDKLKKQQIELNRVNRQLKQKDRYKNIFFENISHEFRQPLGCIIDSLTHVMEEKSFRLQISFQNIIKSVLFHSYKLHNRISQILELSRAESGQLPLVARPIDIVAGIKTLIRHWQPRARAAGIHITSILPNDSCILYIDADKIEQVLNNLLSNACEYLAPGRKVEVILNEIAKKEKDYVKIHVKDDGPGICEKELHHVFDRYYQPQNRSGMQHKGFGIGLALAKQYIEMHSGTITVSSEEHKGTEFIITLPGGILHLRPEQICNKMGVVSSEFIAPHTQEWEILPPDIHILVIESKPAILKELIIDLEKDYSVKVESIGTEWSVYTRGKQPHIIIFGNATINDIPLFHFLKQDKKCSSVPVIALIQEEKLIEQDNFPVDDYFIIPIESEKVKRSIESFLHLQGTNNKRCSEKYLLFHNGVFPQHPVLIVDDDKALLDHLNMALPNYSINNLILCCDGEKVMEILYAHEVSVIILDLYMPGILPGKVLLNKIKHVFPGIPVIIMSGIENTDMAVSCLKVGAHDYLVKPAAVQKIAAIIKRLVKIDKLEQELCQIRCPPVKINELKNPDTFCEIITRNEELLAIFRRVEQFGPTPYPVLITGESGTGKELLARAIHKSSAVEGEFVAFNAGGVDDQLFSDTLFGHIKGAFSTAIAHRKGLIEKARDGTIFLDEIGDLSPGSQIKLLRFIQENIYYPLGSDKPYLSNARVIAATNNDLRAAIENDRFRKDLYSRFIYEIRLPPLRGRMDDIPLLVSHFVEKTSLELGREIPQIPEKVLNLLTHYNFPLNVRELEKMIKIAVVETNGDILAIKPLREYLRPKDRLRYQNVPFSLQAGKQLPQLYEAKRYLIAEALKRTEGNQSAASALLGITQPGLGKYINGILKKANNNLETASRLMGVSVDIVQKLKKRNK